MVLYSSTETKKHSLDCLLLEAQEVRDNNCDRECSDGVTWVSLLLARLV